jgi:hypothetical protein
VSNTSFKPSSINAAYRYRLTSLGDDKRTPGEYLNAIKVAVELKDRAGSLNP